MDIKIDKATKITMKTKTVFIFHDHIPKYWSTSVGHKVGVLPPTDTGSAE